METLPLQGTLRVPFSLKTFSLSRDSSLWRHSSLRSFTGILLYGDFSSFLGLFSMETVPLYGTLWNLTGTLLSEDFSSFSGLFSMETLPLYGTSRGLFSLKFVLSRDFSLWRLFLFTELYGTLRGLFSLKTFPLSRDSSLCRLFLFTELYGDSSL